MRPEPDSNQRLLAFQAQAHEPLCYLATERPVRSGAFLSVGVANPQPEVTTLRQLRPSRQWLVRVPESNTKYGGKGG